MYPWLKRKKILEDTAEHSIFEWQLVNALAFGERSWIVTATLLFFLDPQKIFWSVTGVTAVLLRLFFLSPVYGIFVFLTQKAVFRLSNKPVGRLVDIKELKRQSRATYIFWFPVVFLCDYVALNLFYEVWQAFESLIEKGGM